MGGEYDSKRLMRNFTEAKSILTGRYLDNDTKEMLKTFERTGAAEGMYGFSKDQSTLESLLV